MTSHARLRFPLPPAQGPTPVYRLVQLELRKIREMVGGKACGLTIDRNRYLAETTIDANVTLGNGMRVDCLKESIVRPSLDEALRALLGELFLLSAMEQTS